MYCPTTATNITTGQPITFKDYQTGQDFEGVVINMDMGVFYVAVLGESNMFRVLPDEITSVQK